jgi:hypothetical protein
MRRVLAFAFLCGLAGCASFTGVDPGQPVTVGERVQLEPQVQWASIVDPRFHSPMWTIDGFGLDELHFFVGIADDQPLFLLDGQKPEELPHFKSGMIASDVMELVVGAMSRAGNQQVRARGLAPAPFGSAQGFRFDLTFTSADGLEMKGTALAAVRGKTLDVIVYDAPAEYYFGAHLPTVEKVLASAKPVGAP